jgi:hypothetical protein
MKHTLSLIFLTVFSIGLSAQGYKLNMEESSITLKGSSSSQDWSLKAESFSGEVILSESEITAFSFELPVKSLKSGISALDKAAYLLLEADKHPKIEVVGSGGKLVYGDMGMRADLTFKGVKIPIRVNMKAAQWTEKCLTFTGTFNLSFSDLGLEPVRSEKGGMRTSDEMVVSFEFYMYQ